MDNFIDPTHRGHAIGGCIVCGVLQCALQCVLQCVLQYVAVWLHSVGWLRLVGWIKLQVSSEEYSLFYRALLQKRPLISSILLTDAAASPSLHGTHFIWL